MPRPEKVVDMNQLLDLAEAGFSSSEISEVLNVSVPTINHRIKELRDKQSVLLDYRSVQSLKLTELQIKILDAITDDKILTADLKDLIWAFKVLKDKEVGIETGGPGEVRGLLAHLIFLEKQELRKMDDAVDIYPDPDPVDLNDPINYLAKHAKE